MENTIRTIYGAHLQTCLLLGKPVQYPVNSTLNEKLSIQSGVLPANTQIPSLKFVGIGNKGVKAVCSTDFTFSYDGIQHRTRDAAPYGILPFILREVNDDLTVAQRAKYALRRVEERNGTNYIAYYLKRLNIDSVVPQMLYKTVDGDTTTVTAFTPTAADLNPTPPDLSNGGVNSTTGDYLVSSAQIDFKLDEWETQEFLKVAQIIHGSDSYANITELFLCSGVDKIVVTEGNQNFNEAIGVQVCSITNTLYPLKASNQGVDQIIEIGSTEPLLQITNTQ